MAQLTSFWTLQYWKLSELYSTGSFLNSAVLKAFLTLQYWRLSELYSTDSFQNSTVLTVFWTLQYKYYLPSELCRTDSLLNSVVLTAFCPGNSANVSVSPSRFKYGQAQSELESLTPPTPPGGFLEILSQPKADTTSNQSIRQKGSDTL